MKKYPVPPKAFWCRTGYLDWGIEAASGGGSLICNRKWGFSLLFVLAKSGSQTATWPVWPRPARLPVSQSVRQSGQSSQLACCPPVCSLHQLCIELICFLRCLEFSQLELSWPLPIVEFTIYTLEQWALNLFYIAVHLSPSCLVYGRNQVYLHVALPKRPINR